jgi:hypothetical protein
MPRAGEVYVKGDVGCASVRASGIGKVTLVGVRDGARVDAEGLATVTVAPTSGET